MTRPHLERFVARFGITDAAILLHRHPITLERWLNGQDDIPQQEADWLAGWSVAWQSAYSPEQIEKIEAWRTARASS